ncbi:response regulator [Parasphingorhabdus sp.]|uniref:response regulator n=1 Tax=Parasphingorhabdus sp. TaxID=2709688 RepID=UPI003A8FEB09
MIDDHRLFLAGVTLLLQQFEKPIAVSPFEEPVSLLQALDDGIKFDLIICDLVMPSMNGLAFAQALRDQCSVPLMILSGINTYPPISEMKQLGVSGFVHKSADDADLLASIQTILAGKTSFPDAGKDGTEAKDSHFGAVAAPYDVEHIPVLTQRQIEVLQLISNGASNAEIATSLGISGNTVKSHLRQIFDLLQVNKRTACVRAAQALGLI